MRIASAFFAATLVLGSAEGAILYEHPFPTILTPQACTSCIPQPPQLNRVWDAFDLATGAEITAIEAILGFDASYPSSGTTPINYSIWDQTRTSELFAQDFMPAQLSITPVVAPRYDVLASLGPVLVPAGTYYLSDSKQADAGRCITCDRSPTRSVHQRLGTEAMRMPAVTAS